MSDDSIKRGFEKFGPLSQYMFSCNLDRHGTLNIEKAEADPTIPGDHEKLDEAIQKAYDQQARLIQSQLANTSTPSENSITVAEALKKYIESYGKRLRASAIKDYNTSFRLLSEIAGELPMLSLAHAVARDIRDVLERYPLNRAKMKQSKELSIQDIRKIKKPPYPVISTTTVNKHLGRFAKFFEWAQAEGFAKEGTNPFAGKRTKISKNAKAQRDQFTQTELKEIFTGTQFTTHNFRSSTDFWVPLVALLSGARLAEIVRLRAADIYEKNDIWMIDINGDVKTDASVRVIPLHPKLIELGFLRYIKSRQAQKEEYLFDEMGSGQQDPAGTVGKRFGRYKHSLGFADRTKSFHSFRHTFLTALSKAQINDVIRTELAGHEHATETDRRYVKEYNEKDLQAAIIQANFDEALVNVKPWP